MIEAFMICGHFYRRSKLISNLYNALHDRHSRMRWEFLFDIIKKYIIYEKITMINYLCFICILLLQTHSLIRPIFSISPSLAVIDRNRAAKRGTGDWGLIDDCKLFFQNFSHFIYNIVVLHHTSIEWIDLAAICEVLFFLYKWAD